MERDEEETQFLKDYLNKHFNEKMVKKTIFLDPTEVYKGVQEHYLRDNRQIKKNKCKEKRILQIQKCAENNHVREYKIKLRLKKKLIEKELFNK